MNSVIVVTPLESTDQPAQTSLPQCSVCGGVVINWDSKSSSDSQFHRSCPPENRSSDPTLTSTFFKCLSDVEEDMDIDDTENLNFCNACKDCINEWRDIKDQVLVLTQRTHRLKWTLVAKLLTEYSKKVQCYLVRANSATTESGSKLKDLVNRYVKQFCTTVTVERTEFIGADKMEKEGFSEHDDDLADGDYRNDDGGSDDGGIELERSGRLSFRCTKISSSEFLYAGKYTFYVEQLSTRNPIFHCGECDTKLTRKGSMLRHIRQAHIAQLKELKPLKGMPGTGIVTWKTVGPSEYLFADKFRFRLEADAFRCDECSQVVKTKKGILRHMRQAHVYSSAEHQVRPRALLKPVEGRPNEFLYRGSYSVRWEEDSSKYHCLLCLYSGDGEQQIVKHLKEKHIWKSRPRKNLQASVTTQVAPNEFLYNGKYPIRFDPAQQSYSCGVCDKSFEKMRSIFPHIRGNHYTDEDKIQFSTVQVSDSEYLYGGKYPIHYRGGRYQCGLCSHSVHELSSLHGHIRARHGDLSVLSQPTRSTSTVQKETEPSPAAPTFSTSKLFKSRGIPYTFDPTTRKYICSLCSQAVTFRTSMMSHIRHLHVEKPGQYVCDRCGRSFKSQRLLTKHEVRHGEPKFKCKHCGKLFRSNVNFKAHVAVHEKGEEAKKFVCEYCGKGFGIKGHLNNHVRMHTGEKPFACSECHEMFADLGKKSYHMKTVHGYVPKAHFVD